MVESGENSELKRALRLCLLAEIESVNLVVLWKRKKAAEQPLLKTRLFRKIFERPVYTSSTWWTMLVKGECKVLGHPQNKLFRRRFSVPFSMFKDIVEEARQWKTDNGNKLGEPRKDCVGLDCVPSELKVLGALRMSAKG